MKSILLASTAVIALAGAAAADVSFGGDATLGYNDNTTTGNDGFYWEANVAVTLSQELDNGLTASATFDFDILEDTSGGYTLGKYLVAGGYVLSLESETAGLFFGDTDQAAQTRWVSAGDMVNDNFSESDGEIVLRGDMSFAGWDASVSYIWDEAADGGDDTLDQLSIGVAGMVGNFTVALAYQAEDTDVGTASGDFNPDEIFGLSVGTSFGGADVTFAYASNNTISEDSIGIEVAYPVGPVTLGAYFVSEGGALVADGYGISAEYADGPIAVSVNYEVLDDGTAANTTAEDWSIEGSYDVGNGLTVLAGVADAGEDFYVAGSYDLGGGATLLVSYADDQDTDSGDEVGDPEYQVGTTVEVSFEF